ncbi:hypothetical protein HDV03_000977 [Kappamyces sp. JEL0829]|nr:hypothetical protein HDV03_000977 [Kappamyces sp. JEL0829]
MSHQTFSSAVMLTDLNDFIAPGQDCIKPVETIKKSGADSKVSMRDGNMYEVAIDGKEMELEKAKITLNDCLACSGCITSAETVLIAMQSHQEFLKFLEENRAALPADRKLVCVSVSSQTRASLGAKYGLSMQQTWNALSHVFRSQLGVDHVFDVDFARDIALQSSSHEFMERLQQGSTMLASSCPGWICYAEKTHPAVLPYLDTTKSPQQIMGSLVKDYLAKKLVIEPNRIYHVSLMPCYDKKLEASRQDFYNDLYATRDVDLVLSTTEVETIFIDRGISLGSFGSVPAPVSWFMKGDGTMLSASQGSSSGGYLVWIMRSAVFQLYGVRLTTQDVEQGTNGITIVPGRNADLTAVNYTPPHATAPTLKFAYVYGFRNIQNLVRKLKTSKPGSPPYHFVEVMACPSGCINGGGQARPPSDSVVQSKEWIAASEAVYRQTDDLCPSVDPPLNPYVHQLLSEWVGSDAGLMKQLLHTEFRPVVATVQSLVVKW